MFETKYSNWGNIRLAVVIPWGLDMIWRRTWETYDELEKPPTCKLIFGTGRTPDRRHEIGCEEALKWNASHILILGGDQVYCDPVMIRKMFSWMQSSNLIEWMHRKQVVNCLIPIRGHRPGQGTRPFQTIGMMLDPDNGEQIHITRESGPIVKAEIIGTGAMLFEADILDEMPKPWFGDEFIPGTNEVRVMQDVSFVKKLNKMGCQVWVDTQIIVKHLGVLEIDDSFAARFA